MATSKKKSAATPTYAAAADELDTILDEIENGSADVDELAAKVERASELMRVCRDKLSSTEVRVHKIIESLSDDDSATGAKPSGSDQPASARPTSAEGGAAADGSIENTPPWDED